MMYTSAQNMRHATFDMARLKLFSADFVEDSRPTASSFLLRKQCDYHMTD